MKKELHYGCNNPAICNKQEWQENYQPSKKCADNKCKFVVITDLAQEAQEAKENLQSKKTSVKKQDKKKKTQ